jgi:ABC-type transport system involved in cytochrome bd biosynthesis fused ATPase/permease subunit
MSGATLNPAHSVVKVVGAILWFVGFIALFVAAPFGIVLLGFALVLSILSLTWTRQARYNEQKEAQEATTAAIEAATAQQVLAPSPESAADRIRDLKQLHDDGLITDDEYEQKRKDIVDEM